MQGISALFKVDRTYIQALSIFSILFIKDRQHDNIQNSLAIVATVDNGYNRKGTISVGQQT